MGYGENVSFQSPEVLNAFLVSTRSFRLFVFFGGEEGGGQRRRTYGTGLHPKENRGQDQTDTEFVG